MATQRLSTSKYPARRVDLPLARLLAEAANEELPTDRIASKLNLAEDVVAELAPIFRGMNDTQLAWAVETRNRRNSLERKVLGQSPSRQRRSRSRISAERSPLAKGILTSVPTKWWALVGCCETLWDKKPPFREAFQPLTDKRRLSGTRYGRADGIQNLS